ncbi:MAG: sodium:dicarboxylate symporter [Robiginitomaculum sp.]|nr:MAG: sodium:dicarboxylate symporter [Robiginitomaculum sp.]
MTFTRKAFILIGPVVAILFTLGLKQLGLEASPATAAGITLLTVIWWVTEPIPIPATSLVPFALFPMFGILDHKAVSAALGSHVILLLMGAFMLATALEKSGAHKRLAVYMVRLIGVSSGRRLVMGFMLATGLLSMWISNSASTVIMLPIALAVLANVDNEKLRVALLLGIAYAASIGGIGTPIGTPPNVIFMGMYEEITGTELGFFAWMKIGVPVVVIALPLTAFWLTRNVKLESEITLPTLGAWRREEIRTLAVFGLTALAWMTRSSPYGGWSGFLGMPTIGDSTIALFAVVMMFLIPNGESGENRGRLLDWKTANSIPWGLLLLFAGGIAIAKGFTASGLSDMLGAWLGSLANLPMLGMILTICLVVTYLTEITSNTATAILLMPILAAVGVAMDIDPAILMIPAAMAASCAFMLPVATAPNALVYGLGNIKIGDMVREGAVLSAVISLIIGFVCYWLLV